MLNCQLSHPLPLQDWAYWSCRAQGSGCHLPHPGRLRCERCPAVLRPACCARQCTGLPRTQMPGIAVPTAVPHPDHTPCVDNQPHPLCPSCAAPLSPARRAVLRPQKVPGGKQGAGARPAGSARGLAQQAGRGGRQAPRSAVCQEVKALSALLMAALAAAPPGVCLALRASPLERSTSLVHVSFIPETRVVLCCWLQARSKHAVQHFIVQSLQSWCGAAPGRFGGGEGASGHRWVAAVPGPPQLPAALADVARYHAQSAPTR